MPDTRVGRQFDIDQTRFACGKNCKAKRGGLGGMRVMLAGVSFEDCESKLELRCKEGQGSAQRG
jgi:hypothetical protein